MTVGELIKELKQYGEEVNVALITPSEHEDEAIMYDLNIVHENEDGEVVLEYYPKNGYAQ